MSLSGRVHWREKPEVFCDADVEERQGNKSSAVIKRDALPSQSITVIICVIHNMTKIDQVNCNQTVVIFLQKRNLGCLSQLEISAMLIPNVEMSLLICLKIIENIQNMIFHQKSVTRLPGRYRIIQGLYSEKLLC